jgi:hypothetical protein
VKHESFFSLSRSSDLERQFRIRLARTPADVKRAIRLRPTKYAKRASDYLELLHSAEEVDLTPGSVILFAEDCSDQEVLGTLRLQFNVVQPLKEEELPFLKNYLPGGSLMGISRLVIVSAEARSQIKFALFKAATKVCQALQANWMIVTALPPMDVQFVNVMAFESLMPPGMTFSEPGFPERKFTLLGLEVSRVSEIWGKHDPELRMYMLDEYSPEIEVFSSLGGLVNRSRKSDTRRNGEMLAEGVFAEVLL